MPSPRHLPRAVRRRRAQRRLALVGLAVAIGIVSALVSDRPERAGDDAELTGARRSPTTSTIVATSSTSAEPITTTITTSRPTAVTPGWYAVVGSAPKDAGSRDALRSEVAQYAGRGLVIDTDDFLTGDGQAPDHLPAPGVLAAAVGPFSSLDQVQAWCAGHDGDRGCHARQLVRR